MGSESAPAFASREGEREIEYAVVRNAEEQYSIWRNDRELPLGWERDGMTGNREACLAHIERVWVDMRPKSVRVAMEASERGAATRAEAAAATGTPARHRRAE